MSVITLKAMFHSIFEQDLSERIFLWTSKIACNCRYSQWPHNTAKNGRALSTGFTSYKNTSFIVKTIAIPRSTGRPFGLSCK